MDPAHRRDELGLLNVTIEMQLIAEADRDGMCVALHKP
jgi:hypothetical protein